MRTLADIENGAREAKLERQLKQSHDAAMYNRCIKAARYAFNSGDMALYIDCLRAIRDEDVDMIIELAEKAE